MAKKVYLPSRAFGAAGDNKHMTVYILKVGPYSPHSVVTCIGCVNCDHVPGSNHVWVDAVLIHTSTT